MGRPLYSSVFRTSPVVRDQEPPSYEKWSYLNAFDPDSDEFFDNENAVYEDFIDPVSLANPEEEEEEEDMDMLVVRMGNASPVTSESSLSDSDSPLAAGAEDPAHLITDVLHDISQIGDRELASVVQDPAVRVRLATRTSPVGGRWRSQMADSGRSHPRRVLSAAAAMRPVSNLPRQQHDGLPSTPPPSAPIPVPVLSRRSATFDGRALSSPSTPPRQTPMTFLPMSPPPTSTPRLYSWARNPSQAGSPSPGGPFTNPHARTSYAHISPALIRIRDVTV